MEKFNVQTYLYFLKSEYKELLAEHCLEQLSKHPRVADVKIEYEKVVKSMTDLATFNKSRERFEQDYLRRVIGKFSTDVEIQSLDLLILELILLYALNEHQIESAKVPAIIKLHRDKPFIRPDALVRINAAAKLLEILEREQFRPTTSDNPAVIVGRLVLHLFFIENVVSLQQALQMIQLAPKLKYIDGLVCIELNEADIECRYVLSEPGAIWWLHWLSVKNKYSLNSRKKVSYYIAAYLRIVDDWEYSSVSLPTLKLLRKTDLSLRISPINYGYVTNFFKSASLNQTAFLRILTDKKVPQDTERPDISRVMTVREKRNWKKQTLLDRYAAVDAQESELKRMLALLKPNDSRHRSGRLDVSRNELIHIFTEWLSKNRDTFSPYLWLLMAWAKSLLTDGQVKKNLDPSTIIDYVMTIGPAFLVIFCQYRIDELDPDDWIDLLNELGESINSSQRKGFVIYLASYLRDSELVPDLAVGELEVAVNYGQVDANVISPNHIDMMIQYLMKQDGAVYRDAILLLCLSYFSGLRRNEATYLQLADFTFNQTQSGPIDMYVRPSVKRGLKSRAGRRVLPLDVLWPKEYLALLCNKVVYRRGQTYTSTAPLFEDKGQCEKAHLLITDLMHHVTGDQRLRVHHLRHSFANWQWFRLNPGALSLARQQLTLFNHPLFSAEQVRQFHIRLGLKVASRKSMYVLCHLLGHGDPKMTIGSYLHFRDLAGYLLLNAESRIKDKQLTQTLGRTKVQNRKDCADNLALRLSFETRQQEKIIAPVPYGNSLYTIQATLSDYETKIKIQSDKDQRNLLQWASILMACRKLTPEQIAENEGMSPDEVRRLLNSAEKIQKACSGRGKTLPLIPNLAPWIVRLRQAEKNIESAKRKQIKESQSLIVVRLLFTRIQSLLEQKQLSWDTIRLACQNLKYVVPGKGFMIRSPHIERTSRFLELLHQIGLKARHLQLTLFLDPNVQSQVNAQNWYALLQQCSIRELHAEVGDPEERKYFNRKYRLFGVLQIALVNRKLSMKGRRQRVFISAFQLLAILAHFFSTKGADE